MGRGRRFMGLRISLRDAGADNGQDRRRYHRKAYVFHQTLPFLSREAGMAAPVGKDLGPSGFRQ